MKLLKEIVAQWGNVDAEQCKELACFFPDTTLIIKWGYLPREACPASRVAHRIEHRARAQQRFGGVRALPQKDVQFGARRARVRPRRGRVARRRGAGARRAGGGVRCWF